MQTIKLLLQRRALEQFPETPAPTSHGWKMAADDLIIDWGDLARAPDNLLASTQCGCKKAKFSKNHCECLKSKMSCTDLCKCVDCTNKQQADSVYPSTEDNNDDVDDSDED